MVHIKSFFAATIKIEHERLGATFIDIVQFELNLMSKCLHIWSMVKEMNFLWQTGTLFRSTALVVCFLLNLLPVEVGSIGMEGPAMSSTSSSSMVMGLF